MCGVSSKTKCNSVDSLPWINCTNNIKQSHLFYLVLAVTSSLRHLPPTLHGPLRSSRRPYNHQNQTAHPGAVMRTFGAPKKGTECKATIRMFTTVGPTLPLHLCFGTSVASPDRQLPGEPTAEAKCLKEQQWSIV